MLKQISTTCAARPDNPAGLDDIELTALVELAHRGEERAISLLYQHFAPQLAQMAALQGLDQPDGLASEVLAKSFARLPMMEHVRIETFRAYIFRACRNAIANEHRRRSSQPTIVLLGDDREKREPESTTSNPEAVATSGAWIQDVVSNLTEQQRRVVELRFVDNLTLSETAETLGADVVAVKSTQRRALKALRTILLAAGGAAAMVWLVVTGIQFEASAPKMINTTSVSDGEGSTTEQQQDQESQQDSTANQQDPMALRVDQRSVDDRQDASVVTPAEDVAPPVVVGTDTRSANRKDGGDPGRAGAAEVDVIDVGGTGRSVDSEMSEPEPGAEATPVWVVGSAIELSVNSGPAESGNDEVLRSLAAPRPDQAQLTAPESFTTGQAETAGRVAGEAGEAEAARTAAEAEAARTAAEAEAARVAVEAEAARVAVEAEAARVAVEAEAARVAAEASRIAGELEAARVAAEASRVAGELEAARVAAEASRVAGEAEAARIAGEAEAARIAGEASRIAAEVEAARVAAEAEASRLAEEAAARIAAGREAAGFGADQVQGFYRPSLGCATTCRTDFGSDS